MGDLLSSVYTDGIKNECIVPNTEVRKMKASRISYSWRHESLQSTCGSTGQTSLSRADKGNGLRKVGIKETHI